MVVNRPLGAALVACLASIVPGHGQASARSRGAQVVPQPSERAGRVAAGRVYVVRGRARVAAAGTWVTLHRVGTDSAGPLDSVRADRNGAFAFRYRPRPHTSDAYFVSAMHDGLAYFSSALGPGAARDRTADLSLFDTTSHGVTVSLASRQVVVEAPNADGARGVIEMYVLANAGDHTLVPDGQGKPTFTAELPAGAIGPRAGDGDVRADAMTFADGKVRVVAPVAPGTTRVTFEYTIPPGRGRFTLAASTAVGLLDVLVEDSAGTATGAGLQEQPSGVYAGRTFRHFVASEVAPAEAITVDVPVMSNGSHFDVVTILLFAIAVVLTLSLVRALRRPGPSLDDASLAARSRAG